MRPRKQLVIGPRALFLCHEETSPTLSGRKETRPPLREDTPESAQRHAWTVPTLWEEA